jgi:hypothetical protein
LRVLAEARAFVAQQNSRSLAGALGVVNQHPSALQRESRCGGSAQLGDPTPATN